MKRTIIFALAAASLLCSCARVPSSGLNDASKRYFDAWLLKYHPDLVDKKQSPGYYVLSEKAGTGDLVSITSLTPYVRANYRILTLDGTISASTYESDAYQLRTHSDVGYYGPQVITRGEYAAYAGLDAAIEDMREGGTRELIIPGWLMTTDRYDTEQEYLDNASGTDVIYTINIVECISDIEQWERDSVLAYTSVKYPSCTSDTTGFYMATLKEGDVAFENDTTFYINYIGRRLDGKVFDTNIADTAKFYGIWSSSTTYGPTLINWTDDYSEITMTSDETSVISGFSLMLSKMKGYEKAVGVFTSEYGYSYSGTGSYIPAYCPLEFEIEIVDEED